jgi:hypothetical protein
LRKVSHLAFIAFHLPTNLDRINEKQQKEIEPFPMMPKSDEHFYGASNEKIENFHLFNSSKSKIKVELIQKTDDG